MTSFSISHKQGINSACKLAWSWRDAERETQCPWWDATLHSSKSSRSRRPGTARSEGIHKSKEDVQGEECRQEASFTRTTPRGRGPSARLVYRQRGVAINELVLAQRHKVAELIAQTSKSRTVPGSSRKLPHPCVGQSQMHCTRVRQARQPAPQSCRPETCEHGPRGA